MEHLWIFCIWSKATILIGCDKSCDIKIIECFSSSTLLQSVGPQYFERLCLSLNPIQRHNSNWLWQIMWHKNYWWHHSTLLTRLNDSTSLVTSVKVSWLRPRSPKVRFENYIWLNSRLLYFWYNVLGRSHDTYTYVTKLVESLGLVDSILWCHQ